ncbi:MAG: helix-turn-helix transcriptional regulator [Chlorobium sp.]|nr:helix-turn-helix transcriptional regulator [Chlorobium sp.]
MEPINRLLGLRLKEIRQNRKISQEKLSEKLGVDPKYLSRIEVGKATPSLDLLIKAADILGVEVKSLFEFSHLENPQKKVQIESMLSGITEEQQKLIIKLIKAVVV